jgi:heme oxygenase
MPVDRMLARLDMDTRPYHADIDASWRALTGPDLTRTRLVDHLMRVYGFEGPVEAAAAYTPKLQPVLDLRRRSRSGYLAQDLVNLGVSPSQLTQVSQCLIAPFAEPAEALGWLYVVERSSALHDSVKRHVEARLPQSANGCSYLSFHARDASERWNALARVLDLAACDSRSADLIARSAHDGFRCALHWFRVVQPKLRSVG